MSKTYRNTFYGKMRGEVGSKKFRDFIHNACCKPEFEQVVEFGNFTVKPNASKLLHSLPQWQINQLGSLIRSIVQHMNYRATPDDNTFVLATKNKWITLEILRHCGIKVSLKEEYFVIQMSQQRDWDSFAININPSVKEVLSDYAIGYNVDESKAHFPLLKKYGFYALIDMHNRHHYYSIKKTKKLIQFQLATKFKQEVLNTPIEHILDDYKLFGTI